MTGEEAEGRCATLVRTLLSFKHEPREDTKAMAQSVLSAGGVQRGRDCVAVDAEPVSDVHSHPTAADVTRWLIHHSLPQTEHTRLRRREIMCEVSRWRDLAPKPPLSGRSVGSVPLGVAPRLIALDRRR